MAKLLRDFSIFLIVYAITITSPSIHFQACPVDLGEVHAGSSISFNVNVEFNSHRITIDRVEFGESADWFKVWNTLPQTFNREADKVLDKATLDVQLTVPRTAGGGSYTIPFTVYGTSPDGRKVQSGSSVTFTIMPSLAPPQLTLKEIIETAKRLLGNPAIILQLAVAVAWLSYYSLKRR